MMAVIISTIHYNEVFVAMRTELSSKMEKALLPVPKRFCKFVRACLDIANDKEMYSTLNNLQIISITGQVSCCSVFYEDIETKQETYIKTMHIMRTFERLYKEKIEKILPKIREEYERRELVNTCTNPFVKEPIIIEEQWRSLPYFAAFPHYINQVGLYDLKNIWLETKSPSTSYLILDNSYRVVLGVFPEKARNGIVEKLCKLEWKLKTKERKQKPGVANTRKLNDSKRNPSLSRCAKASWSTGDLLNGRRIDCEKYTVHFQALDLWDRMLLVIIQEGQNSDLLASARKVEMMTSFFPKKILLNKLPFDLHVPKPPAPGTIPIEVRPTWNVLPNLEDKDKLQKTDGTSAVANNQKDKDELQKTDDTSAVTNNQIFQMITKSMLSASEGEDESQKTDDTSAVTNRQEGEDEMQKSDDRSSVTNCQDLSQQSKMTQEDQLILESGGTVNMQNYHSKSFQYQSEVSRETSEVLRNSIKRPKSMPVYRTTSIPHVPLENITIKPGTKASQSSVIDLTPRDIPLIVDTPRE